MNRAQQIGDRAAAWILRQEEPDWTAADRSELDRWLAESDAHKAAYWRLKHSWREADRMRALGPAPTPLRQRRIRAARPGLWRPVAMAASLLVTATIALTSIGVALDELHRRHNPATELFGTPVGGQQSIRLADGSEIDLNTASVVRASVTRGGREIWIDRGEAYFDVARDEGRPFVVHVGGHDVTVLGTRFAVRRDGSEVRIVVREGRVKVADITSKQAETSAAVLTTGEIAVARGALTMITDRSSAKVDDALSWREGILTFSQTPLEDVAAEFNRYNRRKLIVIDKKAAQVRIGGRFPASDPEAFARLLRDAFGLKVEDKAETVTIGR